MSAKRKPLIKKEKQEKLQEGPPPRKPPRGVKLDQLPDAIVDGKWTCNPGDEVLILLRRGIKPTPVIHTFKSCDGDSVTLWDEEAHRWFFFKISEAIKAGLPVKILFRAAQPPSQ